MRDIDADPQCGTRWRQFHLMDSSIAAWAKIEVPPLIDRRRADSSAQLGSASPKIPASSKPDASGCGTLWETGVRLLTIS
jgi:hypothetical protein